MTIKNLKLLLLLLMPLNLFACDICGCFMGLTPYDNQSNFGILHRYRSFSGYQGEKHAVFPTTNATDYEVYRTLELRGRYFLHRRIEINAIVPYNTNTERYNGNTSSISGVGDINLYAGYHLIRKLDQPVINQRLIVGAGLKLPSGKNDIESQPGTRYSALMQPGTGSTDGFIYVNYLLGYKKLGLSINSSYKINGENKEEEGIANSSTSFINLFYTQRLSKNWQIMPSMQAYYENSAGETYKGIETGEHEMKNVMLGAGADIYYKNIALNIGFQANTWQAKTDHLQSAGKVYLGLTYNINQLYYLL